MEKKNLWPGWETVDLIGHGSFGTVYEIRREIFGEEERAALKVISIPKNDDDVEDMYSEGYDEASVSATLENHLKNIVAEYSLMRKMKGSAHIVDCDDVSYVRHANGIGWDIFIKMELLTPLTKALPTQIPEGTVLQIAKDLCAALCLCNKHGIVHRDIKPQNIFVSPNGDYKLGDFGIAKTMEKTMGGTKIGTYKYMAPEVYNNQPYGAAADIYSLGLVLYCLLNERRMPFMPLPPAQLSAEIDEASRNLRLSGEPLPAPIHGSPELKRIVLKACAFDQNARYTSASQMLEDLNNLVDMVAPADRPDEDLKEGPDFDKTVRVRKSTSSQVASATPDPKPAAKPKWKKFLIFPILGAALAMIALVLIICIASGRNGWKTKAGDTYYYVDGEVTTGLVMIGDQKYYFDDAGIMQTGWELLYGKTYYFAADGTMCSGWKVISDNTYYFEKDGSQFYGWLEIGEQKYYLDPLNNGAMVKGWKVIEDATYFFDDNGAQYHGWGEHQGKTRYLCNNGKMAVASWKTIAGKDYYFNAEGTMLTGLQELDGKTYYFGSDGAKKTGKQTVDGTDLLFNQNGEQVSNGWVELAEGKCFAKDGKAVTGWLKVDDEYCYLDPQTGLRCYNKIIQDEKGDSYYLNGDGVVGKSIMIDHNGNTYFFRSDGKMMKGELWEYKGNTYYFDENGKMVKDDWWKNGDKWYWFNQEGIMAKSNWVKLENKWYYFCADGHMATGELVINGKTYQFDDNGVCKNP